ncbi:unnamed protein product [Gemmataceae bacterium]|nr:unnamed protein product [Gemmataceae bacterium]VTT98979.1 unnamed protein product [Gemmataceae bacterium]
MPSPDPARPLIVPVIPARADQTGLLPHPIAVDVDRVRFVVLVEGDAVPVAEYLRRHPERRPEVLAAIRGWLDAR